MSNPQSSHAHDAHSHGHGKVGLTGLVVGAIGVVFGDIGTSPLYTLKEAFSPHYGLDSDHDTVLGVLSLIVWALVLIVTVKYVLILLRADNEGEGGTLSLLALAQRAMGRPDFGVLVLGMIGAALFLAPRLEVPIMALGWAVLAAGVLQLAVLGSDEQALLQGQSIANGVAFARELGNLPPNICNPAYIAQQAQELAARSEGVECEVLDDAAMEALGMGSLLAVARGSVNRPHLVVLKWNGAADPAAIATTNGFCDHAIRQQGA